MSVGLIQFRKGSVSSIDLMRVAVLGGGSFGTALANIVATNGHKTSLWFRNAARAHECQNTRENAKYLPGYRLHDNLLITADLEEALVSAQVVVIAVPSDSYREVVKAAAPLLAKEIIVVSATKGIEVASFTMMSDILAQELNGVRIGVLSGPNFAKEIVANQYTASVLASDDEQVRELIPRVFSSKTFRVYSSKDKFGVELAGALKNIYAIITGMADALGCGCNTHAMIVTRALAEMGRFADQLGANAMTFLGLAGVGDLILTCGSDLSRNYRVGFAIGQGQPLAQVLDEIGQVAEGINTLKVVKQKADELGVYMPLASGLHGILFEGKNIAVVVQSLMTGQMASDVEFH
jgi:glycerol-3-phosphate dehydrogenase (NAD(P)+)